jgi:ubiquinone/menaquinone biosynthesis C-methylase UbiE
MKDALRKEMIKKICVRDGDKILDVGCGDGTFLSELTQWRDAEGYGTDSCEDLVCKAAQSYPELNIETGYSDFLSFDDDTFRIITVCDDFHTFQQPKKFIEEAARVLTPGGRLYIGEAAYPEFIRLLLNIPTYLIPSRKKKYHSTYEILEYFKNAGLTKFRVYKKKQLLLVSAKKPD